MKTKKLTITFENIPEDWTENDIKQAVSLGLFIKVMQKNPEIIKEKLKQAKEITT